MATCMCKDFDPNGNRSFLHINVAPRFRIFSCKVGKPWKWSYDTLHNMVLFGSQVFSMLLKEKLTSFLCHIWPKGGVQIFMWWLNMAHPNNVKHYTTSSSSVIVFAFGRSELRTMNTPPWMDGARIWHFFPLGSCF